MRSSSAPLPITSFVGENRGHAGGKKKPAQELRGRKEKKKNREGKERLSDPDFLCGRVKLWFSGGKKKKVRSFEKRKKRGERGERGTGRLVLTGCGEKVAAGKKRARCPSKSDGKGKNLNVVVLALKGLRKKHQPGRWHWQEKLEKPSKVRAWFSSWEKKKANAPLPGKEGALRGGGGGGKQHRRVNTHSDQSKKRTFVWGEGRKEFPRIFPYRGTGPLPKGGGGCLKNVKDFCRTKRVFFCGGERRVSPGGRLLVAGSSFNWGRGGARSPLTPGHAATSHSTRLAEGGVCPLQGKGERKRPGKSSMPPESQRISRGRSQEEGRKRGGEGGEGTMISLT